MPSGQGLDIPPASAAKRGKKPRRYVVKFARAEAPASFSRTDQDQLFPSALAADLPSRRWRENA